MSSAILQRVNSLDLWKDTVIECHWSALEFANFAGKKICLKIISSTFIRVAWGDRDFR